MVTNAPAEYYAAKKKFEEAKTDEEKLLALYEMLRTAPKHKGSEKLIAWIKKEISLYKNRIKKSKKVKTKYFEKSGDLLISIVGININKSIEFLNRISDEKVNNYSYNDLVIRTIFYNGVYYQFCIIPSNLDKSYRSILSISDYLILIYDENFEIEEQKKIYREFIEGIFDLNEDKNIKEIINIDIRREELLEEIIKSLNLIRVFPINSNHCVLLNKDSTIKDFISEINESWIEKFLYARVIRDNKKIKCGLNYKLEDKDIVELKLKI